MIVNSLARKCSYLAALSIALTPFLINYQAFAVPCNKQVPEDPAPLCGVAEAECEKIVSSGCPAVASCANTKGSYREKVPKECVDGGGDNDHCVWAEDETLCSTSKSCKKNGVKCTAVQTCATVDDSYRTNGECDNGG